MFDNKSFYSVLNNGKGVELIPFDKSKDTIPNYTEQKIWQFDGGGIISLFVGM